MDHRQWPKAQPSREQMKNAPIPDENNYPRTGVQKDPRYAAGSLPAQPAPIVSVKSSTSESRFSYLRRPIAAAGGGGFGGAISILLAYHFMQDAPGEVIAAWTYIITAVLATLSALFVPPEA